MLYLYFLISEKNFKELITWIKFCETADYKIHRNFLQPPITSYVLGPNITYDAQAKNNPNIRYVQVEELRNEMPQRIPRRHCFRVAQKSILVAGALPPFVFRFAYCYRTVKHKYS